jgi:hypothetical protein
MVGMSGIALRGLLQNPVLDILDIGDSGWRQELFSRRPGVLRNSEAPVDWMREGAEHKEGAVRQAVAGNLKTPTEILRGLARDSPVVRAVAAGNKRTPVEKIKDLSEDRVESVRQDVTSNRATPPEVLRKLAWDGYVGRWPRTKPRLRKCCGAWRRISMKSSATEQRTARHSRPARQMNE